MKLKLQKFFPLLLILISVNCDTTELPTNGSLSLTVEDASCTEAWLTLRSTNLQIPNSITIKQNDQVRITISLTTADTLLYLDSLLPNQSYNFQLLSQSSIQPIKSNELNVTTLDTTSHNFAWQTFTFGQHSSSVLYDVAIIDENNIWAVGEIYMNDSLGQPDPIAYNAVHWDGGEWKVKRIPYNYQGSAFYNQIQSVFVFSSTDIWFCGNGVIRWNGQQFIEVPIPTSVWGPYQMNKLWGGSSSDLYVVGDAGNIAHYNGSSWTKIESGSTTNINDIYGFTDPVTQKQQIFCAVSFVFQPGDQKILTIKNNTVDSLSWNTGRRLHSVWTKSMLFVYTSGGGIFENKRGFWNEITEVPLNYSENIRGTELNDIYVCGDFGLFSHFNGSSWHTYDELYMQGIFFSLKAQSNSVVTVGLNGSSAIIVKGTRN